VERELFTSEFIREYLRYIQRRHSTVTGLFFVEDKPYIWGTTGEYGTPPQGGLLVEMWPEDDPDNFCTYRFWHAEPADKGDYKRRKAIMRSEIEG
jgi:hypothetical protein